jgi:hypothetical protein
MRSFRSKPVGWRQESYRHYLAAKGVKTRYYKGKIKAIASFLLDDGRAKTADFEQDLKSSAVGEMRDEVTVKLNEAERQGKISFENSRRFMNDDFTTETKDFLDDKIGRGQYQDNVRRRLGRHLTQFGSELNIFGG